MLFRHQEKVGLAIKILIALMMVGSGIMKFVQPPDFAKNLEHLHVRLATVPSLAVIEIVSAALFLIPRTALFGAILLTGYLGGAIATHLHVGDPWFIQTGLAVMVWLGYGLTREDVFRTALR